MDNVIQFRKGSTAIDPIDKPNTFYIMSVLASKETIDAFMQDFFQKTPYGDIVKSAHYYKMDDGPYVRIFFEYHMEALEDMDMFTLVHLGANQTIAVHTAWQDWQNAEEEWPEDGASPVT